ncbi:TetR/AcrR family transcriptional regulator [Actinomadura spongiicola]|uniref:TetR/AcrR family transcriptional regulator n=1 Tax=Actinomadura spongiicola TaxID=2303421 RepID=A0A372GDF2_9ACTN|nr:TetR/AcrR family transcriptional regulator [Actinomadura spongiicola]RFS83418.1 TetR/AcrR family transcriptional regulator [Actinomadura spongiicola]
MRQQDEIVTAAIRCLNADPTLSMGRLAEAIGVSRATLHRHFATRDALMHALGSRALDSWETSQDLSGIDEAGASGDPVRIAVTLETLIRRFVTDAEEHGYALTAHTTAALPDLADRTDRLERRELAFYTAAQRAGVIRPDLPAAWIGNHVYGLMVAVRESLHQGSVARRDIEEHVLTTLRDGIGGPTS